MTSNEYQYLAMRTNDGHCSDRLAKFADPDNCVKNNGHAVKVGDLINGVMGLSGEAGEATDLVKKIIFHGHDFDIEALEKEVGDVCWYVAMICHALNISLEEVMEKNIAKLQARYPDGFSEEASRNRDTSQE